MSEILKVIIMIKVINHVYKFVIKNIKKTVIIFIINFTPP